MNKSRSVMGIKRNPSPDPINDVCPHQHFKSDIIDRNILSRKQHLNLLCTPKGYRWMIKKADSSRMNGPTNTPCKLTKKKPGKTYVHNILAEMWDLVTPEMVNRMKETLMTEFGLSEEAAVDFICQSRYDTTLTAKPPRRVRNRGEDDRPPEGSSISCLTAAQKLSKNDFNICINPFHIKEFSKAVSSKFAEYVFAMMCAKRNSKHRTMAEVILKGLCDLTGEDTTLESPKNRLHKILATTSDRVALWLAGNLGDDDEERAKRRRREDKILKRKTLARQKDKKNRQKERDKMYKAKEMNEKRIAQEQAERTRLANEEQARKKAEREKRHQEMEKFREEEKQRQKQEIMKSNDESATAKSKGAQPKSGGGQTGGGQARGGPTRGGQARGGQAGGGQARGGQARGGQAGGDRSKVMGTKTGQNNKQFTSGTGKSTTNVPNKGEGKVSSLTSNEPVNATDTRSEVASSEKAERKGSQSGDMDGKFDLNKKEPLQEGSNTSQLSASRSINWGDNAIKNVASAFSASGKLTPTPSASSSVDKLATLLSSRGKTASRRTSQEKSSTALSPQDGHPTSQSSQSIHAKVVSSQGKLASELSSHSNLGVAPSLHATDSQRRRMDLEQELGAASFSHGALSATDGPRRKGSIVTVKKTGSHRFEVRETSYSEAKRKIGAVRRESASTILPPNVPFDPKDPKSWALWVDYATRMAEDWGHWIDKTIQETEDKAILYQAKAIEGKTQPEDVDDWNRFVEKTNEDAIRWRRQRKSIFDAAKEWKLP